MKTRVMIVEDEPIIRMGLERALPWDSVNCEVVALAENGLDGLEKAKDTKPQLVISDIRMPRMDGLAMIKELKALDPELQVILLTGYKEFDYAKKAIAYGVKKYILKPVDQQELLNAIKELAGQVQQKEEARQEWQRLHCRVQESLPILKDKFLNHLLFLGPGSINNVYEKMKYFHIHIERFVILAVEIDSFYELEKEFTEEDIHALFFMIEEGMEQLQGNCEYSVTPFRHEKTEYFIISGNIESQDLPDLLEMGRKLCQLVKQKGKFTVSAGLSVIHEGAKEIRAARKEADRCLVSCYYVGKGSVACYSDVQAGDGKREREHEFRAEEYFEALKQGENVTAAAEDVCVQLRELKNATLIKTRTTEILSKSFRLLMEEYGECPELLQCFEQTMEKAYMAKTLQNCEELFQECSAWCISFAQKKKKSRTEYIIEKAVQYMKENCRRAVSLDEVADELYISKWYFSKLFRKETGIKFTDYMSNLRIEEAQRLIREDPGLKNYEIAEMLGFGNVRYFSQLFKTVTGKTPSEYRG